MNSSDIIDRFGGTNDLARICDVTPQAVSQWRKDGIPEARLMYLKLLRPDVFGTSPTCDCSTQPMKEAA